MNPSDFNDLIEFQLESTGGIATIGCSDGTIFTFTYPFLASLAERAKESGRVVVFVKKGEVA